jgi:hypothetical protein
VRCRAPRKLAIRDYGLSLEICSSYSLGAEMTAYLAAYTILNDRTGNEATNDL